ncbi:MAG: 1-(5-phosphoribosyl)-5-[(5-phosphoribosylamino)methylideneamino]imidazole-4-carboxamide isomerase [Acidobacteria bacterium]|jgi:phosphoribosylformimino-5-aminoimidazole carboxamide ribotide isomerase|nr:1-(5-phosphoribosyl)-5-[(5-phosphoribosylamino)methylideneamino]imidazole-4-carboxamide isomerase [Acidobacteriota bacterium]MBA4124615.1 1-(5-phosphoribosyl)-5-[(5-phosphoribosylamino)methylideneamino]imidazole-4-carboxamide isomerase [Acidobacteriota bacterium]MBA4186140.1 1-(5-phosphoribosyl)-5-[(5-phosphoribosylamino)methylideneamino]imidazole-4-carboxamide isomerase [Acidobacteriota bacterium]
MIEIIPAIDLIDGKCVRLSQGDFSQKKIYYENSLDAAKEFEAVGLERLHIVDLDGAKYGAVTNLKVLELIANNTNLTIDFGGGIKTDEDIESVFDAGAKMASIGSIAIKNAEKFFAWIEKYGSGKILLGADVKNGKLAINGWQTETDLEILPFLKNYYARGGTQVFCTDISKDGLLQGSANELYAGILDYLPRLDLIASGGVSSIQDVVELEKIGCAGVIIGKAFYEGKIKIDELGQMNAERNKI